MPKDRRRIVYKGLFLLRELLSCDCFVLVAETFIIRNFATKYLS
jgi:hypothetical protein